MNRGRSRRLLINVALVAVLVAIGAAAYLTFAGGGGSESQGQVVTASVTRGNVRSTVSASGTVVSPLTLGASFATGGTVRELLVEVGDHVKKGQVLAGVDPSSAQSDLQSAYASVGSAYASVGSAQASLVSAEENLKEVKKGEPTDAQLAQAQAQVVSARAQIDQAEAGVASARSQVTKAQEALDGTVLHAPMTGTVVSVTGVAGETVSSGGVSSSTSSSASSSATSSSGSSGSGASGFIVISDLDHLQVQAYFSETDTAQLKVGQQASVTLNALPGERVPGKVVAIDATSTTVNQVVDYGVTIELRRQLNGVRAGQTTVVAVVAARAKNVLSVPSAAVRTTGGQSTVLVVRNGQQVSTVVEIGLEGDQSTEIVSGLSEGDEVVLASTSSSGSSGFPGGGFPGGGFPGGGIPAGGS